MKVRAIRVAEFARFREPMALEGLGAGLDLFIAPNEAGKSTLLRALQMVLFVSCRTTRNDVAEARSFGSGAPLVEADVEIAGEVWRIRKRFLAERAAELVALGRGTLLRGSDAEDALQRMLVTAGVAGARQLLWPKQGALLSTTAADVDPAGMDMIRAAVEQEVAAAAGGDALRQVRHAAREALGKLLTPARNQPRGRYQEAISRAERVQDGLARAQSAYKQAEALLDRLAVLDQERARCAAPSVQASLGKRLSEAEERLRAGQQDLNAREVARAALADARAAHQAASGSAQVFAEGLAELEKLEDAAREDDALSRALAGRLRAAAAEVEEAGRLRAAAHARLDAAEAVSKRARATARWRELEGRAERARRANDRLHALEEQCRGLPLDERAVREARALTGRIAESTARLDAASVAVTVCYAPGSEGRVRIDGREIRDGERLLTPVALVLDILGLGRIEIEPGASRDRQRIEEELERDRSALERLLAAAEVASIGELEAHQELARSLVAELEAARAEVRAIAPDGRTELEAALAAAAADLRGGCGAIDGGLDAKSSEAAAHEARVQLRDADEIYRTRAASHEALKREQIALDARTGERAARLAALSASLPPVAERAVRRNELSETAERTSQALDEALRLERLAAARVPDQQAMKRLEEEVSAARAAIQRNEREVAALDTERAGVEGALEAARREDIATRVAELEAEAEQAREALEDVAEEVRALQLLDVELEAEEERLRDSYLAPVTARLSPYVEAVFPDAALSLGSGYAVEALRRGMQDEALNRLSDGTREQIAVLVRLAFARLLAEQGMEVPLVLDDALVFSDDRRIIAMHRALELAARSHQVIVFSCREQAFSGLRGKRLELQPWRPERL